MKSSTIKRKERLKERAQKKKAKADDAGGMEVSVKFCVWFRVVTGLQCMYLNARLHVGNLVCARTVLSGCVACVMLSVSLLTSIH